MGEHRVAGPVLHGGDLAESGEQTQVAAIRSAIDLGVGGGHEFVCRVHAGDEIAVCGESAGGELPTPPFHLDRMGTQPRVIGAGLGDGTLEIGTGVLAGSPMATPSRPSATSRSGTEDAQSPACTVPIEIGWASGQRATSGSTTSCRRVSRSASDRQIGQNLSMLLTPSVLRAAWVAFHERANGTSARPSWPG